MPAVLLEFDLRRRNCRKCGRWKHAIDFPWRWKARGKVLEIPYIHSTCSVCKKEKERKRYNELSDEERREKGRKANAQAYERRYALEKKILTLQERIKKYKERLGRQGTRVDGDLLLDLLPLRMFLLRQARILDGGVSEIARRLEVDEARVRRHVDGFYWVGDCKPRPVRQVTFSVVDEYLVRLNAEERLEDLYPELDDLLPY